MYNLSRKYTKRKRRGQNRCNYNQNDFQTRNRSLSGDKGVSYRCRGRFGWIYRQHYRGRLQKTLGMTTKETIIEIKCIGNEVKVETITEVLTETVLEMTTQETVISVETGVG